MVKDWFVRRAYTGFLQHKWNIKIVGDEIYYTMLGRPHWIEAPFGLPHDCDAEYQWFVSFLVHRE